MSEKFRDKYRIESARLQNWDYGWRGAYFITICTKNRECYFGNIENGEMILSQHGRIACEMWYEITSHAKHIELDEFVVMPNHVHGVLIKSHHHEFNRSNRESNVKPDEKSSENSVICSNGQITDNNPSTNSPANSPDTLLVEVETRHALSLPLPTGYPSRVKTIGQQRFQNPGKNTISSIIGGYKSAVSKNIHRLGLEFTWQSRFYDHIIRDENEYHRIARYIRKNIQKWNSDRFNFCNKNIIKEPQNPYGEESWMV